MNFRMFAEALLTVLLLCTRADQDAYYLVNDQ